MALTNDAYIIDTCSLVNIHEADNAEEIWSHFVSLSENNTVKTVQAVLDEFKKRWPDGYSYVKPVRHMILVEQYNESVFNLVGEITTTYEKLIRPYSNNTNPADPWVIAAAQVYGLKIVTDENDHGPGYTSKIPYVASQYGVSSCGWKHFLNETGFEIV